MVCWGSRTLELGEATVEPAAATHKDSAPDLAALIIDRLIW